MATTVEEIERILMTRDEHQPEFIQAVMEVLGDLKPIFEKEPKYIPVFEQLMEPERVIIFRVPWMDDKGITRINRGFRVQYNSAIGPYKGGIRFTPKVDLSTLKFLGFEQTLKNSLTSLPMGGGKGGADFDPKGKSNGEVIRFCQSFMIELYRHIGADTDVPAGDIGVGPREIGAMFGQYKRIVNRFEGVFTGKRFNWGGSLIRPEATGFGAVYFLEEMLKDNSDKIEGKVVVVSGSGNVAQGVVRKLIHRGAKPISMSDSSGCIIDDTGITEEKLNWICELKNVRRGRISEYVQAFPTAKYFEKGRPWKSATGHVDVAMPAATQNELDESDALSLVSLGCRYVAEGANMPSTPEAIAVYFKNNILFGPGKAVNAGGVATSGLEMTQNSMRMSWPAEKVDKKLHSIMVNIFATCRDTAIRVGQPKNYMLGANVAGFLKVADSMLDQGPV